MRDIIHRAAARARGEPRPEPDVLGVDLDHGWALAHPEDVVVDEHGEHIQGRRWIVAADWSVCVLERWR